MRAEEQRTYKERLRALNCVVVIPTYNNRGTIADVIASVKEYAMDILVVNDGATDGTPEILAGIDDIKVIGYGKNKGKGYAIRTAFKEAAAMGFKYMLTIDSDGQHFADDIPVFIDFIEQNPDCLLIGARNLNADNMPSKNTFANKFSNFWFKVETGQTLSDTQSGYRLYPLEKLSRMRFMTRRYEFEVEVIVRAAWRDIKVHNVPIKVYYAPKREERVSHFKPLKDFTRISLLNTVLVLYAILVYYPYIIIKKFFYDNVLELAGINSPRTHYNDARLAASVGWGVCCGILPIWGYQGIFAIFSAHFMKINKLISYMFTNVSIPPMIPVVLYASATVGAFLLGKESYFDFNNITLDSFTSDLGVYIVGSLVLAPIAGLVAFCFSYLVLRVFHKLLKK